MADDMPVKLPDAAPVSIGSITAIGSWLVTNFGPTETILIVIAGVMLGVVMGWMPSPMMSTMQAIREDQIRKEAAITLMQEREKEVVDIHTAQTALLRIICVHDSTTDQQKAECWK